jgi:hypothetical protein
MSAIDLVFLHIESSGSPDVIEFISLQVVHNNLTETDCRLAVWVAYLDMGVPWMVSLEK